MKKLITAILVTASSLCLMNKANSQVIDADTTGSCTWSLTGSSGDYTLTISGNGAMGNYDDDDNRSPWYSYNSDIKTLDIQQGVTAIGNHAFNDCRGLTSAVIPNSVATIGNYAFASCSGLTSATIGNSVTTIGDRAFRDCTGLTSITIPHSVTSIGNRAFSGCSSLTDINVDVNNTHYSSIVGVLFNKSQDILIQYPTGKSGSYTIPHSVTSIGDYAFFNCTGLTSLTIPNSVATIGIYAIASCSGLTLLTIPASVASIGQNAFGRCTSLSTVNFNATNCTFMGGINGMSVYPVFQGCSSFTTLNIGNNVQTIPDVAFGWCTGLTSLTIPNAVTSIGNLAFYNCTGLTEIYVKATTPPLIEDETFERVPANIPVYVCGEVEDYRNTEYWNYFFTNFLQDNNCGMAVENLVAEDIIHIYPNPATDNIIISLREMITNAVFTLYDMQGKVLIRQAVTNEDVISVNEFAAGVYIYNVSAAKEHYQGKIVISE